MCLHSTFWHYESEPVEKELPVRKRRILVKISNIKAQSRTKYRWLKAMVKGNSRVFQE